MSSIIVTHTAPHQADEVMAICALRIIDPEIKVVRTRESALMENLSLTEGAMLLDVGGRYDPDKLMFDHHQPQGAGFRKPDSKEWPYATAGLVWKHYGAQVVQKLHPELSISDCEEVAGYIDDYFMRYLDAIDCGVRLKSNGPSVSAIIASFNPSWFEDTKDDSFSLILDLMQVILSNFIRRYAGKILARAQVRNSKRSACGRILQLDQCLPWSDVVAEEMPQVLLVTYPVEKSTGDIQWQIRTAANADNTPRITLPASWGGYDGKALEQLSGIPGAVFCHRSRHLMGATSFSAITMVAEKTLAQAQFAALPLQLAA